jgi:hypothetical protein
VSSKAFLSLKRKKTLEKKETPRFSKEKEKPWKKKETQNALFQSFPGTGRGQLKRKPNG